MRKAMKVLLPVDGSEYSYAAVEEAARTTWAEGSVVKIVSVGEFPMTVNTRAMPALVGSYAELERIFEERALANITLAMARFGELAGAQMELVAKTLKGDPK